MITVVSLEERQRDHAEPKSHFWVAFDGSSRVALNPWGVDFMMETWTASRYRPTRSSIVNLGWRDHGDYTCDVHECMVDGRESVDVRVTFTVDDIIFAFLYTVSIHSPHVSHNGQKFAPIRKI